MKKTGFVAIGLFLVVFLSISGCVEEKTIYVDRVTGQEISAPNICENIETPCADDRREFYDQSAVSESTVYSSEYLSVEKGHYNFQKGDYNVIGDEYKGFCLPDARVDFKKKQVVTKLRFNQKTALDSFKWQINKNDGSSVSEHYEKFDNDIVFQKGETVRIIVSPSPDAAPDRTFLLSGYNDDNEIFVVECGIDNSGIHIEEVFNPEVKWS